MLGRDHISPYNEYALCSTLSKYSTLIAIVSRGYIAVNNVIIDFHLMMVLLICKYEPL